MSIAMEFFSVPLTVIFDAVLSVATGVCGYGWPISSREVYMYVAFYNFTNHPPNSASVDDIMVFFVILYYTCKGMFPGGIAVVGVLLLGFGPKKKIHLL